MAREQLWSADLDDLVKDYLRRLRSAARGLPRRLRHELVAQVSEHIAEARAAGEMADEVSARNVLDQLGDPAQIVAAARSEQETARPGPGGMQVAAVLLLLAGGALGLLLGPLGVLIGWVVGAVLLWSSPRWRWGDKLIGTLVWPGGLAAPILLLALGTSVTATSCSGSGSGHADCRPTAGLSAFAVAGEVTLAAIAFLAPIAVAVYLLRRARAAAPAAG
jgi:hypothetical protein